jgi:hypothetical protein
VIDREALITEGRRIIEETDPKSWRLAQIIHDLHEDGMSHAEIAQRFGWDRASTSIHYKICWVRFGERCGSTSFAEAMALAHMSDTRSVATLALSEATGNAVSTTHRFHAADVREIAAEIANLPKDQKHELAKELAHDIVVRQAARTEDYKERADQLQRLERERPSRFAGAKDSLTVASIRLAIWKTEKDVHDVLDGRSEFTDDERTMLNQNAQRLDSLADLLRMYAAGTPDDDKWAEFEASLAGGLNG